MFSKLYTLMENSQTYKLKDEELNGGTGLKESRLETGRLPLKLCEISFKVMEMLGVTSLQAPTTKLVVVDGNRIVVTGEGDSSRGLTLVCDSFCLEYWVQLRGPHSAQEIHEEQVDSVGCKHLTYKWEESGCTTASSCDAFEGGCENGRFYG